MPTTLHDLGKLFYGQLYASVNGGDDTVPAQKDSFVSWCSPALAFEPQDFKFAVQGLASGTATRPGTADEDKILNRQAASFANLIDFIPDVGGIYDGREQDTVWRTSQARLSYMYGETLKFAKVVSTDLTPAEKAQLERFRGLLAITKKRVNPFTGEDEEVTEPSPVMVSYSEKMEAYINAALEYNAAREAAQVATGPEGRAAVAYWTNNASLLRLRVKAAKDAWTAQGYRNDVDRMNAYIAQTTQRDMLLWKQKLIENFEEADVESIDRGHFKYTTLVPASFATNRGWTKFSTSHTSVNSSSSYASTSWGGSAGLNLGFFSIGGGVSSSERKYSSNFAISEFQLSFELTQAGIVRPWFYPEFFMNKGWDLPPGCGWHYPAKPSDGVGKPPNGPKGTLIGYPTSMLFARNVKIVSKDFVSAYKEYSKSLSAGASVGWGPFQISGHYSNAESGRSFSSTSDATTLTVPGLQVLGFINRLIPKSPDLAPGIKQSDLK